MICVLCTAPQTFERRAKEVKNPTEAKYWENITPEMMSDEEPKDDSYVRHPPRYRSEKLNSFLTKLDQRSMKKNSQPRKRRVLGSPRDNPVPKNAKDWMLTPECRRSRPGFDKEEVDEEEMEERIEQLDEARQEKNSASSDTDTV